MEVFPFTLNIYEPVKLLRSEPNLEEFVLQGSKQEAVPFVKDGENPGDLMYLCT